MSNVTTSGIWTAVNPTISPLSGLGTSATRWGTPAGMGRTSGYRFDGRTAPLVLDGSEFILGVFTHENFPIIINGPTRFQVGLAVAVVFETGVTRSFSFTFSHYETNNYGRSALEDADLVDLPTVISPETMFIDGRYYQVEIVGFKRSGVIVTQFVSYENASNYAEIIAKLVDVTPVPPPVPVCRSVTFEVANPDGSTFGRGCFSYETPETDGASVNLAYVRGGPDFVPPLLSFWYHDPLIGTQDISQVLTLNYVNDVEGRPPRFAVNAFNAPDNSTGITAGVAKPDQPGPVTTHRVEDVEHGNEGRTIRFPRLRQTGDGGGEEAVSAAPAVDLVIAIDTSGSMRGEAEGLSAAVSAAITAAKSKCPSDLRVEYLGLEGKFANTIFQKTVREYLCGGLGLAETELKGRKRGGGQGKDGQEDGARNVEDISLHYDWRAGAARNVLFLGDEALEGGDPFDDEDVAAANRAIDTANQADVNVHTYLGEVGGSGRHRKILQGEFARVAAGTGGRAFTSEDTLEGGFQQMLEEIICASRPAVETEPDVRCPCCREDVESGPSATAPVEPAEVPAP
jgi:hypothetical protein